MCIRPNEVGALIFRVPWARVERRVTKASASSMEAMMATTCS